MNSIFSVDNDSRLAYWDNFYHLESQIVPTSHSQFAEFCLPEIQRLKIKEVVDLACGTGRDSKFFLCQGLNVIATDLSEAALASARHACYGQRKFRTFRSNVTSDLQNEIPLFRNGSRAFYARFLLHALTDEEIKSFLNICSTLMGPHDALFLEYRTEKDAFLSKQTSTHFRNFLNPETVQNWSAKFSLKPIYRIEAQGLAKQANDNAFVARQIFMTAR
jgi:SAM-dependent methyltransferase